MASDVIIWLDDNVIICTVTFIFPENVMYFLARSNCTKMGHANGGGWGRVQARDLFKKRARNMKIGDGKSLGAKYGQGITLGLRHWTKKEPEP